MIYRKYLEAYRNDLSSVGSETLETRRVIKEKLEKAMPFCLSSDVIEVARSVSSASYSEGILLDMLRSTRFPAQITWLEWPYRSENQSYEGDMFGLLIDNAREDMALVAFPTHGDRILEPPVFVSISLETSTVEASQFGATCKNLRKSYERSGYTFEEAQNEIDSGTSGLASMALKSTLIFCHVLHLLEAKNGPLASDTQSQMSRQERRALERKNPGSAKDINATVKVTLNAEGRKHLETVREEEAVAGGARRRAHWVRGHLMNSPSKGRVWRNAHVRGFGDPVMRTREVTVGDDGPEI